jgi:hypothetical protein
MSSWFVAEKSRDRIVTEESQPKSRNPLITALTFALLYFPGISLIWFGLPFLPNTVTCQSNKNISVCQRKQHFQNIPIRTETFEKKRTKSDLKVQDNPGAPTLFLTGLSYVCGLTLLTLLYARTVTIRELWIFDKNSNIVKNQKFTKLFRKERRYHRTQIFGIILEIRDVLIKNHSSYIFLKLNLKQDQQVTRYDVFNKYQPWIYNGEYDLLREMDSSVIQPICQMLDLPLQIKFFSQFSCTILDSSQKSICVYEFGKKTMEILFQEVQKFEVDTLMNGVREENLSDSKVLDIPPTYYRYVYTISLITHRGQRIPIHQVDCQSAHIWGQPLFESLPTDDNPGYLWTSQLVTWLGEIVWDA